MTGDLAAGQADVVLDCRWLSIWGAGRVTELLLEGLAEEPPPGTWVLWGPAAVRRWAWPGARVVVDDRDPRPWFGQGAWARIPRGRLVMFLHQKRPLRAVPAITVMHDTIPLRFGGTAVERRLRRLYLRRVAALSHMVVTTTEYARSSLRRDLGVDPAKIAVLTLPVDWERAERVRARREREEDGRFALYLGWFAPHKNVDRLIAAFARTSFGASGGRLVLVGGSTDDVRRVGERVAAVDGRFVDVRGWVADDELDDLMARATVLVQPSLEEGFGLPVAEALASGLPVCVSDGGALPEIAAGLVAPFPATSVDAMAAAIDDTTAAPPDPEFLAKEARARFPTVGEYAHRVCEVVEQALMRC